jgi:hypothetical protein
MASFLASHTCTVDYSVDSRPPTAHGFSERINAFGAMALSFQLNKAEAPQVRNTTDDAKR